MLESSRFPTNPSLATFGQEGNSRFTQPLLLRELLVLHQVLLTSNQEEEEQEEEEKKKRGDATLQTSLHTVQVFRLLCNVTILIISYKYISSHLSVSHLTHAKLRWFFFTQKYALPWSFVSDEGS